MVGMHFLCLYVCASVFPQKVVEMLEEGLVRGQMNMEAKLCSPIHSTFEEFLV